MIKYCKQCNEEIKSKHAKVFCGSSCAAKYNNSNRRHTKETKNKIKKSVDDYHQLNKKEYEYVCEKCKIDFKRSKKIRKGKRIHCDDCKKINWTVKSLYEYVCEKCGIEFKTERYKRKDRKIHCYFCTRKVVKRKDDVKSIKELSKRTVVKILKRAKAQCAMCEWNKTSLDIHHVVPRKDGGTDENSNLIALCPNCHRMAHEGQYRANELLEKTINITLDNWEEFYYNPSCNKKYENER